MASTIKKAILAASIALISFNAQAMLTSYTANGVDVVYSSVSDVTWTKDANLLGSMIANQGYANLVNSIISTSPTITHTPSGLYDTIYTLSTNDFASDGQTTWFGALAFANYLNSINYGGSDQWRLPTVATLAPYVNPPTNGSIPGDELPELFFQELGGVGYNPIPDTNSFDNEKVWVYWSNTEYDTSPAYAWFFSTTIGFQGSTFKGIPYYAWLVTPGQIATVPEPENLAMLLAGLGLLGVAVRRSK